VKPSYQDQNINENHDSSTALMWKDHILGVRFISQVSTIRNQKVMNVK